MQHANYWGTPAPPRGRDVAPASLFLFALLAAAIAFASRFLSHDRFSNDHFVHLSLAQALLDGDWPIRDYTEVGAPLMVALSAGAELLLGRGLFAEVILTVASLSLAAGLTCWITGRLTGSPALGFLAALVQIAAFPRLYGYLKMTLYPVLFLIGWAYLRRPTTGRLVALAAWTAFAFLLRHDHGVYTAIGGGAAVLIAHWSEGFRRTALRAATYAAVTLLWLSPYLWYVQREQGLVAYFQTGIAVSRAEAGRADWMLPRFSPIRPGPYVILKPRAADDLPAIAVRWRTGLPEQTRLQYERALDLRYPELRDDGQSWRYRVEPPATQTLGRLISMRDVMDTAGFDRRSLGFENVPSVTRRILIAWNLDRLTPGRPLADLFSDTNSTGLLFCVLWALPVATVVLWLLRRKGPEILLLAAVAMPTVIGLVRTPNQTRVPDGFGMAPILAAWVIAAVMTARPRFAVVRFVVKTLAIAAGIVFAVAVTSMTSLREKIDETRVREGTSAMLAQARDVVDRSSRWPWAGEWPSGGGYALVPYLNRCSTSGDRLLVLWNAPQFNVFSRRAFAGGETLLMPLFRETSTYEPAVLAKLDRQRVPFVLADLELKPDFDRAYPGISSRIASRYTQARVFDYDGQRIALFVDNTRQSLGNDRAFNLPCFAP